MRQSWRLVVSSTLLYTLAFNLTFFIQELFLVVPKALTPDLRPTLYHNNHLWQGENPIAHLLQGTGALAIFISATVCMVLLERDRIPADRRHHQQTRPTRDAGPYDWVRLPG